MTLKNLLIIMAIFATLIGAYLFFRAQNPRSQPVAKRINFYFDFKQQPSLKIDSSDYVGNQILLKHLVATLLRYKSGGVFQPYLAKSWSVSDDRRTWKFQFSSAFKTEDGELIDGNKFTSALTKNLKVLAGLGDVPIFQDLAGWAEFVSGKAVNISGINATANEVTFSFIRTANEGFLEYLCMPYYGYANYRSNGELISSGPFTISSLNEDPIILRKRKGFPAKENGIEEVAIFRGENTLKKLIKETTNLIVQSNMPIDINKEKFTTINGSPDILFAVVLDVGSKSVFKNGNLRAIFKKHFSTRFKEVKLETENSVSTKKLFLDFPDIKGRDSIGNSNQKTTRKTLNVFSLKSADPDIKNIEHSVFKTLESMGYSYAIKRFGQDPEITVKDKISREKYDVRIVSVYSGPTFDAWVTDMMFCSNLGISFPDPSGDVCRFVKDEEIAKNKRKTLESIANAVERDNSVIPAFYKTNIFYVSKNIETKNIEPDTILIGFDEL